MLSRVAFAFGLCALLAGCADHDHQVVVSIPEQRLAVLRRGEPVALYPVSTSRFGLGDRPGSNATPLGQLEVADKIGGGAPLGEKFKSRRPTGEVVAVDAPGRDPIVTRILWLRGLEPRNAHAHDRCIYIHGTPEEWRIGQPASYGCIRMRSRDVVALYDEIGEGARVSILTEPLAASVPPLLAHGVFFPVAWLPAPILAAATPAAVAATTRAPGAIAR